VTGAAEAVDRAKEASDLASLAAAQALDAAQQIYAEAQDDVWRTGEIVREADALEPRPATHFGRPSDRISRKTASRRSMATAPRCCLPRLRPQFPAGCTVPASPAIRVGWTCLPARAAREPSPCRGGIGRPPRSRPSTLRSRYARRQVGVFRGSAGRELQGPSQQPERSWPLPPRPPPRARAIAARSSDASESFSTWSAVSAAISANRFASSAARVASRDASRRSAVVTTLSCT